MKSVLLVCALLSAAGCARAHSAVDAGPPVNVFAAPPVVTDITAKDYRMPELPRGRIRLKDAFGGEHTVQVEVAATADSRTRGLMWRTELKAGTGMFFIFPAEEQLSFWMRNTLIPLDMIFIGKDRKIVGIVENAEPQTLTGRRVKGVSQYVLEVPGGWSAQQGVGPGGQVVLDGLGNVTVGE